MNGCKPVKDRKVCANDESFVAGVRHNTHFSSINLRFTISVLEPPEFSNIVIM
jgi:hypothetical protein